MFIVYDTLYLLTLLFLWPLLILRRLRRGPGSMAIRERLGGVPRRPVASRSVWIHGVSLGEINATRTLVSELHRRDPSLAIVISSTTAAGMDAARRLYPQLTVFRFPVDLSFVLRRVLDRIRPSVIVLMELEAWPNLIEVANARDIPVVIANGRVTEEKSMRRFDRPIIRSIARRMFGSLTWVGAQDEQYAARFIRLGVRPERVTVVGSMKYDTADVGEWIEGQEQLATEMTIDRRRPLWVCGSTGPEEEAFVLDAYVELLSKHPDLQLAIIPRKPERFDEVARLIVSRGYTCLRRSGAAPLVPPAIETPRAVFLGDTLGELRKFYGLATVVFVGRTLVPLGGSDVMEVAGLGRAMIVGPFNDNFAEAVGALRAANGVLVISESNQLAGAVERVLTNADLRQSLGTAARGVLLARRGATQRTVERLQELI